MNRYKNGTRTMLFFFSAMSFSQCAHALAAASLNNIYIDLLTKDHLTETDKKNFFDVAQNSSLLGKKVCITSLGGELINFLGVAGLS